jgi:RimJ/RimL family protein N-acetyltransferase
VEILLETERLILRRFEASDADNLVELDGDPEVMRYLTGGTATPRETVENELLPKMLRDDDRWAAVEKSTGAFVGWLGIRRANAGEVELGFRLRRSAWGRGYATEGSRALIRVAFAELGVQRVFAETMAVNTASRRVMEKAGLRFVRTFHQSWDDPIEGTEHGEVEYELRREDWEQMQT